MLLEKFAEQLITAVVPRALGYVTDRTISSSDDSRLVSTQEEIEAALRHHLRYVANWCSAMPFSQPDGSPVLLNEVFTPLDVSFNRQRDHRVPLDRVIAEHGHLVILGQPGAGKTSSVKHICFRLLTDPTFLFEPQTASSRLEFPLVIELRQLARDGAIHPGALFQRIKDVLGLRIAFAKHTEGPEHESTRLQIRNRLIAKFLDDGVRAMILLDGLDEIPSAASRAAVIDDVRDLSFQLERSRIVLSSRTGDFTYRPEGFRQCEIQHLTEPQKFRLASAWLQSEAFGGELIAQLHRSPYADTAIRPLMLAHLCSIFQWQHKIPDRPQEVYRQIVDTLLFRWDASRNVERKSRYAQFDPSTKARFLHHLAYQLTAAGRDTSFTRSDLTAAYEKIHGHFSLPSDEAQQVAGELESHTGLIIDLGYAYAFAHKSLQEYLTGEYLRGLPTIPRNGRLLSSMPNELAIAAALSTRSDQYLIELGERFASNDKPTVDRTFLRKFVARLMLELFDLEPTVRGGIGLLRIYSAYVAADVHAVDDADGDGSQLRWLERQIDQRVPASSLVSAHYAERYRVFESERVLELANPKDITELYGVDDSEELPQLALPKRIHVRTKFVLPIG